MKYQIHPNFQKLEIGQQLKNGHEEYFLVTPSEGDQFTVNAWDYKKIYEHEGLYEAIFNDFYQTKTHIRTIDRFCELRSELKDTTPLHVFDYAAGIGLVGQDLVKRGLIDGLIGMDKIPEAKARACFSRSSPYLQYFVGDLATPDPQILMTLQDQNFNAIFCCSAVGTGDADKECMKTLVSLLPKNGYLIFNVRAETTYDQIEIVNELKKYGVFINDNWVFHRKLLDSTDVYFRILILRKS